PRRIPGPISNSRQVPPGNRGLRIGMRMSFTSEFVIFPNAAPMTTPTARSITLPRIAKVLNSLSMDENSVKVVNRQSSIVNRESSLLGDSYFQPRTTHLVPRPSYFLLRPSYFEWFSFLRSRGILIKPYAGLNSFVIG